MKPIDRRTLLTTGLGLLAAPAFSFSDEPKKDPYADGVLKDGLPEKPGQDSFCIAVLPDTQHYSEKYPKSYMAQTEWITKYRGDYKIEGVLHLGDITNHSTDAEWANASKAMAVLDDAKMPYAMCPGNHDYSESGGCTDRTTKMSDIFTIERFRKQSTFGGVFDKEPTRTENSYHLWTVGGRELLILSLEFGPRNDVLTWANRILSKYPKRETMIITHAFIFHDDTRYDFKKYKNKQSWNPHTYGVAKATNDDVNDGEEIWTKLIAKHENVIMTLNGHVLGDGLGRFESKTPGGRVVPQHLVNFQMRPNGGDGWLRLLEFKADRSIVATDYSPVLKKVNHSTQNHFTFKVASIGASS